MKPKIVITPEPVADRRMPASQRARMWRWEIKQGRKVLFGGYCRTKKDAENDAGIVWRDNVRMSDGGRET